MAVDYAAPSSNTYLSQYDPTFGRGSTRLDTVLTSLSQDNHAAISFDISAFPDSGIVAVSLDVYALEVGFLSGRTLKLWFLTDDEADFDSNYGAGEEANWNDRKDGVAWTTAGGTHAGTLGTLSLDAGTITTGHNWIDLTSQYIQAKAEGYTRLGIVFSLLGSTSGGSPYIYLSPSSGDPDKVPTLTITSSSYRELGGSMTGTMSELSGGIQN